ncbi:MAG: hypothetical protein Q8755_03245, partial [Candidatus Phytoplasma australasiaticum]|nr:hypothetical protein [Candidatus Phytoplasma australasiaticum]
MDEVRMQKDEVRDKSIRALTTQMGQLAAEVAQIKKGKGQLPSDTETNPKNVKQVQINMVSIVSDKKFNEANLTPCQVVAGDNEVVKEESEEELGAPIVPIR